MHNKNVLISTETEQFYIFIPVSNRSQTDINCAPFPISYSQVLKYFNSEVSRSCVECRVDIQEAEGSEIIQIKTLQKTTFFII